jgi:hypothetical protein
VLLGADGWRAHARAELPPAPRPVSSAQAAPVHARVGVYLLSIGKLDIGEGTYTMDMYLSFTCDRPCEPSNFEFLNGRAASISKQDDLPQYKTFRVLADLTANFDLRNFPFDSQKLSFAIEDQLLGVDDLVYEVDAERTSVPPELIVAGWDVDHRWQARVIQMRYPIFDQAYSRYVFEVGIDRPLQYSLLKNVLPGVIIVVTGLLALLISTRFMLERLTISGSALLGAILYHLQITQNIPPLPYLTFLDRFMLINYGALALTLASTVALMVIEQRKRDAGLNRVYSLSLAVVPPLWLLLELLNGFTA